MKVSVIVPTRDRYDSLCRTIDSIRLQNSEQDIEIVVIDDASDPPLSPLAEDIKLLRLNDNAGACVARNAGVGVSTGDLLLFIDDDAEMMDNDGLTHAVNWFLKYPKLGVVGFRQLTPQHQVHYMQPANSNSPVHTGIFYAYGCMIRREAFELVQGLNEEFEYYYEEIEFGLKIFAAGYEIIYDPGLMVVHHQDDRHRNWSNIRRKTTRNALLSYFIHYPILMLPALITKRLLFHVKQMDYNFTPLLADIYYLIEELFRRRDYIINHRNPLPWSKILKFHDLCSHPMPIEKLEEITP